MSGALNPKEWVGFVSDCYLDDFIAGGGSAVKFVVCYDVETDACIDLVSEAALRRGFCVADIDSRRTQIHLIERVFGGIADQLQWPELVDEVVRALALAGGLKVPDLFRAEESIAEQLGALNQLDREMINLELRRAIRTGVMVDKQLAKDFRIAMTWLALARLGGGPKEAIDFEKITDWLGASISKISVMRDYSIFNKISRANARYMLGSLLVWIRMAKRPGLMVNINASRLMETGDRNSSAINYSKAAVLDAYEVFRQFIDATDEMEGLLINVFVPPTFLDLETTGRGIGRYPALMYRVYDEIRDRELANPLSALVRISDQKKTV